MYLLNVLMYLFFIGLTVGIPDTSILAIGSQAHKENRSVPEIVNGCTCQDSKPGPPRGRDSFKENIKF